MTDISRRSPAAGAGLLAGGSAQDEGVNFRARSSTRLDAM